MGTAKKTHFHINTYNLLETLGIPLMLNIYMPAVRKPRIGFALIFVDREVRECLLWDIKVDKEFRRRGAASAILSGIKSEFNAIITSNYSPEGKFMCLKNGFIQEKTKDGNDCLVWRKEEKDATQKRIIEKGDK